MIALGSGQPSRAICSTLIAQAFQFVKYPILPRIERLGGSDADGSLGAYTRREIMHIRHHSLYAPRDFDLSPFFKIVKPSIEYGFDYKRLEWAAEEAAEPGPHSEAAHEPAATAGGEPQRAPHEARERAPS
jgi:hypothetical protein